MGGLCVRGSGGGWGFGGVAGGSEQALQRGQRYDRSLSHGRRGFGRRDGRRRRREVGKGVTGDGGQREVRQSHERRRDQGLGGLRGSAQDRWTHGTHGGMLGE